MAGKSMVGSQKEMTAVVNNLKESRILEKSIQTLTLEESYSTKLLDLNNKIVRFQYGRLKSNVGKIKSHLGAKEIDSMRSLEGDGRLKLENSVVSSSSASKIAAAARRLKLMASPSDRRVVSAAPRLQTSAGCNLQHDTKQKDGSQLEEESTISTTSSSRRSSIMSNKEEVASVLCLKVRPKTSTASILKKREPRRQKSRMDAEAILARITAAQKARKNFSQKTFYSCHDVKPGQSKDIDDVFGPNPYEVRRRRFLEAETHTFNELTRKKQNFLEETVQLVADNSQIYEMKPEDTLDIIESIDSMARRPGSKTRLSGNKSIRQLDTKLFKLLNEMRKTRYLRIDDDLIEYSNFNTLAKDHYGSNALWRDIHVSGKDRLSFKTSVAL